MAREHNPLIYAPLITNRPPTLSVCIRRRSAGGTTTRSSARRSPGKAHQRRPNRRQFRHIISGWDQHLFWSQTPPPICPNILHNVVTLVVKKHLWCFFLIYNEIYLQSDYIRYKKIISHLISEKIISHFN